MIIGSKFYENCTGSDCCRVRDDSRIDFGGKSGSSSLSIDRHMGKRQRRRPPCRQKVIICTNTAIQCSLASGHHSNSQLPFLGQYATDCNIVFISVNMSGHPRVFVGQSGKTLSRWGRRGVRRKKGIKIAILVTSGECNNIFYHRQDDSLAEWLYSAPCFILFLLRSRSRSSHRPIPESDIPNCSEWLRL